MWTPTPWGPRAVELGRCPAPASRRFPHGWCERPGRRRSPWRQHLPPPAQSTGPSWVMVPNAVPAPDKSAAPISRNRMLRVNATRTVNGMDTSNVGTSETRATIRSGQKLAELERPPESGTRGVHRHFEEPADGPGRNRKLLDQLGSPSTARGEVCESPERA